MESKKPAISVILSTYNQPAWLEKVLWGYSVQQFKDFEIVVADDGSGTETAECIHRMRIKTQLAIQHVWHHDNGFRKCEILNHAIMRARAEYLVFSDGDCIPRNDFLTVHFSNRRQGQYLSGGAVRLPLAVSREINRTDIVSGCAFSVSWLQKHSSWSSLPRWYRLIRVSSTGTFARVLNHLTPTRPTWNGNNSSAWKKDVLAVNGMDERMAYGGEDCELGDRLANAGVRPRQLRYSAALLHLDHDRGYVREDAMRRNAEIRKQSNINRSTWTDFGIRGNAKSIPDAVQLNRIAASDSSPKSRENAPRFFICDSEIFCYGGHNVELACVIAEAAEQVGFDPVVLSSRDFQNMGDFQPSCAVRPTFRFRFMRKWSLGVDGKSRTVRGFDGRITAKKLTARTGLQLAAERMTGDSPSAAVRSWANDFTQWCDELRPTSADRILLSTGCDFVLLALVSALQNYSTSERLNVDVLFHLSLIDGREGESNSQQNPVLQAFKTQVEASLQALAAHEVRLYATTQELARQLNQAVGRDLWTAINYPIRMRADTTVNPEQEHCNEINATPSRLLLAGNIRREKGRYQLAALINKIWRSHLEKGLWQLAFQLPVERWKRLLPRFLWPQVAIFRTRQDRELVLGDATPDAAAYHAWIHSANVGLFLYDGRRYYARCSGILLEMLAAGIPVIVPAGSWLSRQLRPAVDRHVDSVWDVAEVECNVSSMTLVNSRDQTLELDFYGSVPVTAVVLSFPESPTFGDSILLSATFLNSTAATGTSGAEYSLEYRENGEPRTIVSIPRGTNRVRLRYRYAIHVTTSIDLPTVRLINTAHAPAESAVGLVATNHDQIPRLLDEFQAHREHYQATAKEFSERVSALHSPARFVNTLLDGRAPKFLDAYQGNDEPTSQDIIPLTAHSLPPIDTRGAAERFSAYFLTHFRSLMKVG